MHATGSRSRRCHPGTTSIALFLVLSGIACAAGSGRAHETIPAGAVFDFENSSLDPVTVYLAVQPSQWLLGYVEPGRRAHLRLPVYFAGSNHDDVTVSWFRSALGGTALSRETSPMRSAWSRCRPASFRRCVGRSTAGG